MPRLRKKLGQRQAPRSGTSGAKSQAGRKSLWRNGKHGRHWTRERSKLGRLHSIRGRTQDNTCLIGTRSCGEPISRHGTPVADPFFFFLYRQTMTFMVVGSIEKNWQRSRPGTRTNSSWVPLPVYRIQGPFCVTINVKTRNSNLKRPQDQVI